VELNLVWYEKELSDAGIQAAKVVVLVANNVSVDPQAVKCYQEEFQQGYLLSVHTIACILEQMIENLL
jgi:hypothetical protein